VEDMALDKVWDKEPEDSIQENTKMDPDNPCSNGIQFEYNLMYRMQPYSIKK
jgi:hypothetical protein